jgi:hypothetical protein
MNPIKMTAEIDALLTAEAERRSKRLPMHQRTRTKSLADQTGLAYAYVANIISRKRREFEATVNVPHETSTRCEVVDNTQLSRVD